MYAISDDGCYYSTATYDTKEEAIKAGCKEYEKYTNFYVGETVTPKVTFDLADGSSLAENVIESIQDNLDNIGGEFAENFSVTEEEENSFAEHLTAAVNAWIETRNIKPGFFLIENAEKIHIPDFLKGAIK